MEIISPGFGYKKGVYILNRDISPDFALRLLNNRNAKIVNYETYQQPSEEIHPITGQSTETSETMDPWADNGDE